MESGPNLPHPSMQFLFHSVVSAEGHTKYYNVYKIDKEHFFAQCHHFNREHACEGDFELHREGSAWVVADKSFDEESQQIGGEIDRMYGEGRTADGEGQSAEGEVGPADGEGRSPEAE